MKELSGRCSGRLALTTLIGVGTRRRGDSSMERWHQKNDPNGQLCCACQHRWDSGFWFVHVKTAAERYQGEVCSPFGPDSLLSAEFHRLDSESGWIGYDSESFKVSRRCGGQFVCQECALYECEILYGSPQLAWSTDINELDGEEPRLSRILRQYSGLERPSV
jgi:hypothetical protein